MNTNQLTYFIAVAENQNFTKAAAQEMSVKFKKKFGEPNGITFSTIHALCLKILMTYGGLSAENIIKTSDQWKFLLETARKCQSVCDPAKAAGNFQMLYSAAMNNRMSPSEVNPKDIKGISRKDFPSSLRSLFSFPMRLLAPPARTIIASLFSPIYIPLFSFQPPICDISLSSSSSIACEVK